MSALEDGDSGLDPTRTLTVRGQELRVAIRYGAGPGPPLLLCCGIGAPFEVLQPFVEALDPMIEVVRFDVPGVGGSPTGRIVYGFPGTAYLAARMLRRLGYRRVDVLGLSWGGALAQQLAMQYPGFVRKVVLVGTGTGSVMVPGRPQALVKLLTPRRFRDPRYAASVVGGLYGGSARTRPEPAVRLLVQAVQTGSTAGYIHQLLAGVGWTSLPWLPFIRQPTLILAGDDDPIVPLSNGRILARLLPHARLHVYAGGHVTLLTEPEVLAPTIAAFLLTSS